MNDDKDSIFSRRFLAGYAVFLSVCALAYIACVTFLPVPTPNVRFADTVLGFILGTVLATPIAFYFGSSKSSQSAQQAIVAQLPPPPPPVPPAAPPADAAPNPPPAA